MSGGPCEMRDQIRAIFAGSRTAVVDGGLAAHLENCAECQAEFEALDGAGQPIVDEVQKLLDPQGIRTLPALESTVKRLCQLREGDGFDATFGGGTLGDFRIVRELARGGMGIVYEAEQLSLGRRVALKTLPFAGLLDDRQLQRFQIEARVAATLEHPNIVSVYGVGVERGLHYYAMRYIDGRNLAQVIEELRQRKSSMSSEVATKCSDGQTSQRERNGLADFLSTEAPFDHAYLQAVARIGVQAAQALDYAHEHGILHRDVKPSNLMLDQSGRLWLTDFGLARVETDPVLSVSGALLGTPRYMSPEQALGRRGVVDHRSDVYSLGVTLYELLTLTPIFPEAERQGLLERIATTEPTPPRHLNPQVPADLQTIVLKAMAKSASERYETAGALALDLTRFLESKPILARPARPIRRFVKWVRRRPAAAALVLVSGLAALFLMVGGWSYAAMLQSTLREQKREALQERMQFTRLAPHLATSTGNWFETGWNTVREASVLGVGDNLRNQAATFLQGPSAQLIKQDEGFNASSVAFDAEGRRLLIGGSTSGNGVPTDEARIWDSKLDQFQTSGLAGAGPVAFRPDGTAWQVIASPRDRFTLVLWDVAKRRLVREIHAPGSRPSEPATTTNRPSLALSPDGAFVVAAYPIGEKGSMLVAWDATTGNLVRETQTAQTVTAVALTPDGAWIGAGDATGGVTCWPLPQGEPVSLASVGVTRIESLAFTRSRRTAVDRTQRNWLLAGGEAGGTVTIWDLKRRAPMTYCPASFYDVYAVAFGPDGTTLASSGRSRTRLWDLTTGRLLLEIEYRDFMSGLAFTRDGRRLAASMEAGFSPHGGIQVWDLESDRGILNLRGLAGVVAKVVFARNGKWIAALSQDWQVGIWDLSTGFLQYVLDVPQGITADNSALAFTTNGEKFAFVAGTEAKLWDPSTGQTTSWQLPAGVTDTCVFDATGTRLFLLRSESLDRRQSAAGGFSMPRRPLVCRVRDLLSTHEKDLRRAENDKPLWETSTFDATFQAVATPDGRYFVVQGLQGPNRLETQFKAYESATGRAIWSTRGDAGARGGAAVLDAAGHVLALDAGSGGLSNLLAVPSFQFVGPLPSPSALAPNASLIATQPGNQFGIELLHQGDLRPFVTLGIDRQAGPGRAVFNSDGTMLAWGNRDGTVTVCRLDDVRRRLSSVGLGW